MRTVLARTGFCLLALLALTVPAAAQELRLQDFLPAGEASTSGRMVQLVAAITVLSVAPSLLIMVTSFTRFVVAFSFLRAGLGLGTVPANLVLVSLALFMTFYVMGPTLDRAWQEGVQPLVENRITEQQAVERIAAPFHDFMRAHVREKDLAMFEDLSRAFAKPAEERAAERRGAGPRAETPAQRPPAEAAADGKIPMRVLIPAFMISELRRGFEIGFLIVLPFLVIDIIVSAITMSMGMMMLSPTVISLPLKALFFVLVDGWNLLVGGLVRSFL